MMDCTREDKKIENSTKVQCLLIILMMFLQYGYSSFSCSKSLLEVKEFHSEGDIMLMAATAAQLTMILAQGSLTSYLNTPSQRLTALSKYKARLSEDESRKETMF